MAASKKNAKSTKTAHVLNLLTAPGAEGEAATTPVEGESVEPTAETAAARPLTPPILEVARSDDEQLSGQILQALEEEFPEEPEIPAPAEAPVESAAEAEKAEPAPEAAAPAEEPAVPAGEDPVSADGAAEPAAEEAAVPAEEAAAPAEAAAAPAEEPPVSAEEAVEPEQSAGEPEPAAEEPAAEELSTVKEAMEAAEESAGIARDYDLPVTMQENPEVLTHGSDDVDPNDENLNYVNVMQILVEEKAPRYIKMFGLCPCRRCELDVKALTLSNLVPKYVVMHKKEMVPMLTIYESRYSSTIFAQLTRSCKIVMDRPHHGRE